MLPSSIRVTLLREEVWKAGLSLCFFWTNRVAYEDDVLSFQRLKSSFVYVFIYFCLKIKLFINDDPLTLNGFIDWLGFQ